jgi:hypothetical protein
VYDLQGMMGCLYGGYALSQDIDASPTKKWNDGNGFTPIKNIKNGAPFSGVFDGNNHVIRNLYINRPEENDVGLFGYVAGSNNYRSVIKDFDVENAYIRGKRCVGVIIGEAKGVHIDNIHVIKADIYGEEDLGSGAGCVLINEHKHISADNTTIYENGERKVDNGFFGSCVGCEGDEKDKK